MVEFSVFLYFIVSSISLLNMTLMNMFRSVFTFLSLISLFSTSTLISAQPTQYLGGLMVTLGLVSAADNLYKILNNVFTIVTATFAIFFNNLFLFLLLHFQSLSTSGLIPEILQFPRYY